MNAVTLAATAMGRQSIVSICAAMGAGTVALIIPVLQPYLLGALVEQRVLNEVQLGHIATLESFGLALVCGIAPRLFRYGGFRKQIAAASVVLAIVNLAMMGASTAYAIGILRTLAGAVEGLMLGATMTVIVQSAAAERLMAVFIGVCTIPQALGAYFFPVVILPQWGVPGSYVMIAGLSVLVAASTVFLEPPARSSGKQVSSRTWISLALVLAILGIMLQNASCGAAWSYIERLGREHRISNEIIGFTGLGCLVMQVIGAFLTAWVGWRLAFRTTLIVSCVAQAGIVVVLGTSDMVGAYVGGSFLFGVLWAAMTPFQLRLLIDLDPTRIAATLIITLTLLGQAAGPAIGAFGAKPGDVSAVYWIAAAVMILAMVAYLASNTLFRKQPLR